MKKIIITLLSIIFPLLFAQSVLAVTTSTPSATPTTNTNMEDKIKILVQENLSTTEAKLKQKVDLQALVGYLGNITTINSNNFTIESHDNLIQVSTSDKTALLKDSTTIKFSSLAINDKVIIIGTSVKDGIVQAKRVSVIKDDPNLVKTSVKIAKIVSIDIKKKNITLNLDGSNQVLTLSKKSTVKLEELKSDQTILAIIKEYNGSLSISRAKVL